MSAVLAAILKAVLGAIVDGFNDWRRDRALERLGYERAGRAQAEAAARAGSAMAGVPPLHGDALGRRLRDGTF